MAKVNMTFRRSVLSLLALFILFLLFGGRNSLSRQRILRDKDMEQQLLRTERGLFAAIREIQQSSAAKQEKMDMDLKRLQVEKKVLENQVQELRRLPSSSGVDRQLAYQYPYVASSRFPAYIWQTWKDKRNDRDLDSGIRQNFESWEHLNDGFAHEVLTDKTALQLVEHLFMSVPSVVEAYKAMPEPVLRADFFRYLILLARGGVYTDADTEALKPVPVWIPSSFDAKTIGMVIGIEADPNREDWAQWYARRIQFCQWTIQAKAGHPILRDIIANITAQTLTRKNTGNLILKNNKERGAAIMDWTGPGIWTDTIFKYLNNAVTTNDGKKSESFDWELFAGLKQPLQIGDILVLPITSFSPGIGTMGAQSLNDPLAYVHHKFEGSWKPVEERIQ